MKAASQASEVQRCNAKRKATAMYGTLAIAALTQVPKPCTWYISWATSRGEPNVRVASRTAVSWGRPSSSNSSTRSSKCV